MQSIKCRHTQLWKSLNFHSLCTIKVSTRNVLGKVAPERFIVRKAKAKQEEKKDKKKFYLSKKNCFSLYYFIIYYCPGVCKSDSPPSFMPFAERKKVGSLWRFRRLRLTPYNTICYLKSGHETRSAKQKKTNETIRHRIFGSYGG